MEAPGRWATGRLRARRARSRFRCRPPRRSAAGGDSFICAALTDGSVWCWGADYDRRARRWDVHDRPDDSGKIEPCPGRDDSFHVTGRADRVETATTHVIVGFQIFSVGSRQICELGLAAPRRLRRSAAPTPVYPLLAARRWLFRPPALATMPACLPTTRSSVAGATTISGSSVMGRSLEWGRHPTTVTGLTGTPRCVIAGRLAHLRNHDQW